jgi:hypothetical protein
MSSAAIDRMSGTWGLSGAAEAIRAVSALIIGERPPGELGVFVRFVAPDALPLSTAYGRKF